MPRFRSSSFFLIGACIVLVILWLPSLKYPVVSDSAIYAVLGRNLWEHGSYVISILPRPKYLPLHAIFSIPFTQVVGIHAGMHMASLVAGIGTLGITYFFFRRIRGHGIAAAVTVAMLLQPAFLLMAMLGSADLLFAFLFFLALFFYLRAERDQRFYVAAGVATGLACLTRYNGVPLFVLLFLWTAWERRRHLRSAWFWSGMTLGAGLFGLWFLRSAILFGNPFYSDYTTELTHEAPNPLLQFLKNAVYYGNPLHNILPYFFVLSLVGLWKHARQYSFLVAAMLTAWLLSSFWWVPAIRFFFPGYPILLFFAVLGLLHVAKSFHLSMLAVASLFLLGLATQLPVICVYTYGACNAWVDRHVGILPKNLHLSPEGFYAWDQARTYLNAHAESGAYVRWDDVPEASDGIFRSDLRIVHESRSCPQYAITQRPEAGAEILFQTIEAPETFVVKTACAQ